MSSLCPGLILVLVSVVWPFYSGGEGGRDCPCPPSVRLLRDQMDLQHNRDCSEATAEHQIKQGSFGISDPEQSSDKANATSSMNGIPAFLPTSAVKRNSKKGEKFTAVGQTRAGNGRGRASAAYMKLLAAAQAGDGCVGIGRVYMGCRLLYMLQSWHEVRGGVLEGALEAARVLERQQARPSKGVWKTWGRNSTWLPWAGIAALSC